MNSKKINKILRKKFTRWTAFGAAVAILLGIVLGVLALAPSGQQLMSSTLSLPATVAPQHVPNFSEKHISDKWDGKDGIVDNDKLLKDLARDSLVASIIRIAKYILGGIFAIFFGIYVIALITSGGNDEEVKKFKDQMIWSLIGFLVIALAEPVAYTFFIAREGGNFITDPESLKESVRVASFSLRSAARFVQYLLGAMALLFMGTAAFKIVTAAGNEEEVKNARKTLVWATLGLIIATVATTIVDKIFAPLGTDSLVVNLQGLTPVEQQTALLKMSQLVARAEVVKYVKYFQTFAGAAAVLMLFISGAKMIMASGNEEIITKQRKMITWIFLGLGTIMMAEVFVNIFLPELQNGGGLIAMPGATELASFSMQMGGMTNFIISFASILSLLAMVVGGLYYSTAGISAEQADKGKQILLAAALGLVLTISAFALVNTVLSGKSTQPLLGIQAEFKNSNVNISR